MRPPPWIIAISAWPGAVRNLNVILALAGVVLVVAGAWSLRDQLGHRSPVEVTCAEYARRSLSVLWLRARDCDIDYLNAGYRESRGTIQELFFAVRPAGASRTQPAVLVMATRDPSVLAIAQGGIGEGQQPNQEQFLIMMLRIVTALNAARRIEGRLRVGWMDRLRARRVLSGLTTPVAPSAMVVDLHASPAYTGPAIQMALGTALVIAAVVLFRKGRRTELDLVPAAEPALATEPVVTTPVRLRGLLLLNLAPGGNAADIEYAPPLGNRDEVIERIAQAIGGIQFDARGRGVLRVPEVAAIIDVGRAAIVSSATAGAEGAAGAAAIARLLAETGWRAYVPIEGRFLE
jgi:hypothetical protein